MKILQSYLWKEWREQRAGVIGLVLMLPCLPLILWAAGPGEFLDFPWLPQLGAAAGFVAAVFVIGTHIIPGTNNLGGTGLLRRMPVGLHRAFAVKLGLFLLILVGCSLYGDLVGTLTLLLRGSGQDATGPFMKSPILLVVLPAICAALWIFAVSSWVPNGTLAFPVGLICCAVFCWPAHTVFLPSAWSQTWYAQADWDPVFFLALSGGTAILSGWVSYAYGLRYCESRQRSAMLGLGAAVVGVLPMWGWTAYRWVRVVHVEVGSEELCIRRSWLTDDFSEAIFWTTHEDLLHRPDELAEPVSKAYRVNLASGSWEATNPGWLTDPYYFPEGLQSVPHLGDPVPLVDDLPVGTHLTQGNFGLGRGIYHESHGRIGIYDPIRGRCVLLEEFEPPAELSVTIIPGRSIFVLPEFWLVRSYSLETRGETTPVWFQVDPETREWTRFEHLKAKDAVSATMSDGTLLLLRDQQLMFVNPVTGELRFVRYTGDDSALDYAVPMDGRRVLEVDSPIVLDCYMVSARVYRVGVLDPVNDTFRAFGNDGTAVLQQASPNSVLLLENNRRVLQFSLDTGESRQVFPPVH